MSEKHPNLPIRCRGVIVFVVAGKGDLATVLVLRRVSAPEGAWCPVTGTIEPNERAWQTALREIEEEAGIRPPNLFTTGCVDRFYDPVSDTIELMPVFLCWLSETRPVAIDSSHSDYRWAPVRNAWDLLSFSGHRDALQSIRHDFIAHELAPFRRIYLATAGSDTATG
jgi:dihydroneopterin triphosphate diphosphatase